jgi:hypothetical protein
MVPHVMKGAFHVLHREGVLCLDAWVIACSGVSS